MSKLIVEQSKPVFRDDYAVGIYANANDAWQNLYYGLNKDGAESSPRGIKVRETLGCNIYILNPRDNLVFNVFRGVSPIYLSKEYEWYKSGSRKVEDAVKLSKFWGTIANPDGTVNSNYGAYIFVKDSSGKSVWDKTVDLLRADSFTRQAIIQIPIMPARATKDTPCTSHIHFQIRDNKLFATTVMRSTDVILGFPLDIYQFTMWQIEMAAELGIELGWHRFISDNLHVYEKNWIENVSDSFVYSYANKEYTPSDKSTQSYKDQMHELATLGKDANPSDEMLKFMLEHKKIWK